MAEFPVLDQWVKRMLERPGVEKGRHVPSKHNYEDIQKLSEEELDARAAGPRKWIQDSMKEEAK